MGRNTGALAPRVRPKAGLGVGCGRRSPPPSVRVLGYQRRKIFENSDAKSCILVTTCCEISCFLETTAKKLGDQSTPVPTVVAPMGLQGSVITLLISELCVCVCLVECEVGEMRDGDSARSALVSPQPTPSSSPADEPTPDDTVSD